MLGLVYSCEAGRLTTMLAHAYLQCPIACLFVCLFTCGGQHKHCTTSNCSSPWNVFARRTSFGVLDFLLQQSLTWNCTWFDGIGVIGAGVTSIGATTRALVAPSNVQDLCNDSCINSTGPKDEGTCWILLLDQHGSKELKDCSTYLALVTTDKRCN